MKISVHIGANPSCTVPGDPTHLLVVLLSGGSNREDNYGHKVEIVCFNPEGDVPAQLLCSALSLLAEKIRVYETAIELKKGQIWKHRNGNEYEILLITNELDDPKYPKTVVYKNTRVGTVWSRFARNWAGSFTLIKQV